MRDPTVEPTQHLRSDVPGVVPCPEELLPGEIAVNTADVAAYVLGSDGRVRLLNEPAMELIAAQRAFAMTLIFG